MFIVLQFVFEGSNIRYVLRTCICLHFAKSLEELKFAKSHEFGRMSNHFLYFINHH